MNLCSVQILQLSLPICPQNHPDYPISSHFKKPPKITSHRPHIIPDDDPLQIPKPINEFSNLTLHLTTPLITLNNGVPLHPLHQIQHALSPFPKSDPYPFQFASQIPQPDPNSQSSKISCALIEPDGGKLVELLVSDEGRRREKKREATAARMPRIKLSRIDVDEGWASPCRGFMRENEFLKTLHFNSLRLGDGSIVNMSVPIVLAIDDDVKARTGDERRVALFDGDKPVAILSDIEIYKHNKEERIARTWGTTAPSLPYVEEAIANAGNWLVGGDLELLEPIKYHDDRFRLSPAELCSEFERCNADAVLAFQLRNPVHNGHALLMTDTHHRLLKMGYKNPILLLHPLGVAILKLMMFL
ncbi:ATP sulfurylase 1, chloroplastic-like protein [Drosera capensis]